METITKTEPAFLSRGLMAVVSAQFLSAFADCALVFATLGLLIKQNYPDWSLSLLQMFFVGTYIILAPFVGYIADAFPKGRVMMLSNGLKLVGALVICVGLDPFFGYTLVGFGAAAYSPAKYGILGEMVSKEQLVKANSLIESSTIVAILTGSLAGGIVADISLTASLAMCAFVYVLAVIANIYIPRLAPATRFDQWNLIAMLKDFVISCGKVWSDKKTRVSLVGTSLFWGAGITLRSLLVLWVPVAFGLTDIGTPTKLSAVVSVGIVFGAIAAAKLITLRNVNRCIPAGIVMGAAVIGLMLQNSMALSYAILIFIGVCGGFFIVPLNTLLQDRGKLTVGAGNAIALQNFGENVAMLVMLGIYTIAVKMGVYETVLGISFGGVLMVAIGILWLWQKKVVRDW